MEAELGKKKEKRKKNKKSQATMCKFSLISTPYFLPNLPYFQRLLLAQFLKPFGLWFYFIRIMIVFYHTINPWALMNPMFQTSLDYLHSFLQSKREISYVGFHVKCDIYSNKYYFNGCGVLFHH